MRGGDRGRTHTARDFSGLVHTARHVMKAGNTRSPWPYGERYDQVEFQPGDVFVFGCETRGLPASVMMEFPENHRLRLPMLHGQRSLNLSNAVAVMVFEAWRQHGFPQGI